MKKYNSSAESEANHFYNISTYCAQTGHTKCSLLFNFSAYSLLLG